MPSKNVIRLTVDYQLEIIANMKQMLNGYSTYQAYAKLDISYAGCQ